MSVESKGDMKLSEADEMNIPVNLFVSAGEDECADKWELSADNFMPRKQRASDSQYHYIADTKEELMELVEKHVIPLYETAIKCLRNGKLYYWELPVYE